MKTLSAVQKAFSLSEIQHPGLFVATEVSDGVFGSIRKSITIVECEDPLVPLPSSLLRYTPHPYQSIGAPYSSFSPWHLRKSVLKRLLAAEDYLKQELPGASLCIYDAYRPVAVQKFMVHHECQQHAQETRGCSFDSLSEEGQGRVLEDVLEFWASPSTNPETPPPHSTGSAVDLTILSATGDELPMGTAIDQISPLSHPFAFMHAHESEGQYYHNNRMLLLSIMEAAGFHRLPSEWWHFSFGDQTWATLESLRTNQKQTARFGRYE